MKFGALLRTSAQEMPDLQGLFNCYKQLKKRLKRLPEKTADRLAENPAMTSSPTLNGHAAILAHERAFVALLVSDIQAFNETYVEKEEQSVIKLSLLEDRSSSAKGENEKAVLYKDFVNFHGQTLMLVHWSILAYTSVLKILKKHHKRTGLRIQEFNMQQLLSQPFCSVEVASELVRKAEAKAQELASSLRVPPIRTDASFASSHSSPVAGELMEAARESVRGISDSAAMGNEALEQHLTDQASSSEDMSEDAKGEAEVVSSRNAAQGGAHTQTGAPIGHQETRKREASDQGGPICKKPRPDRDDREPTDARHKEDARWTSLGGNKALINQARRNCDCKIVRTLSVAGENQVSPKEGVRPVNGAYTESDVKTPSTANEDKPESVPSRNVPGSVSSGSNPGSKSPQLTVGQGWAGGSSENILKQTQMALGLWEQLHETASTPSTVVPPLNPSRLQQQPANSAA